MPFINNIIPPANFELVRDRIGQILFTEIENQWLQTYSPDLIVPVWVERTIPFDHVEAPCININLAKGDFGNKDRQGIDGTYQFNIDFYTKAKDTDGANPPKGDQRANIKLQRLMAIARAILENDNYYLLLFNAPSIMHLEVASINIALPEKNNMDHVAIGRMIFNVRVAEVTELTTPNTIDGYDTGVKMALTDKGYVFSGTNPIIPPDICEPATILINGIEYGLVASGATKDIILEYENGDPVPWVNDYGIVVIPDPGAAAEWGSLQPT